jgi:hypothetical protein
VSTNKKARAGSPPEAAAASKPAAVGIRSFFLAKPKAAAAPALTKRTSLPVSPAASPAATDADDGDEMEDINTDGTEEFVVEKIVREGRGKTKGQYLVKIPSIPLPHASAGASADRAILLDLSPRPHGLCSGMARR